MTDFVFKTTGARSPKSFVSRSFKQSEYADRVGVCVNRATKIIFESCLELVS